MFQRKVGNWLIRTGAVESGKVETRITRDGKLALRREWATASEAMHGHALAVREVEAMVARAEVAA